MRVINDLHCGVLRSAGTTPQTALSLRTYTLNQLGAMLNDTHEDLIVLGDLFDTYSIPLTDLWQATEMFKSWLDRGHHLYLIPGNHDLSTDNSRMSSFEFLARTLEFDTGTAKYMPGGGWVDQSRGVYAISHVTNQDLLDHELSKVPQCRYLLLHANYDNHFAKEADHSLNVSEEQAKAVPADYVCFAHEHNARTALGGKVVIFGNQFPTSISDCLEPLDKHAHRLVLGEAPQAILTWKRDDHYAEVDWRSSELVDKAFIRIVGTASADESAAAADAVARYRRASEAFVVGNAVKVESSEGLTQLEVDTLENVRAFDVMGALREYLTPEEMTKVESVYEVKNGNVSEP